MSTHAAGDHDLSREILIPALLVAPLALSLVYGGPQYMAGVAIMAMAGLLFLTNPRAFMLVFLVAIAMRDWVAGGDRIDVGFLTFDLGGLVNVLTTLIGVTYFLVLWRNPFRGRSLTWPYLMFLGAFSFSLFYAPSFRDGIRFVTRLAAPFVTYLIISDMMDKRMVRGVIRAMYASSIVPLAAGFFQLFTGTGNTDTVGYNRVFGCFNHPALYSMYLLFIFCLAYSQFLDKRTSRKPLWAIYVALVVIQLLATYTRISWIAFALCFGYLSWVYGRRRYVIVAVGLGVLLLPVLGEQVLDRLVEIEDALTARDVTDRNNSVGWRLYYWTKLIEAWERQPLLGYGAGATIPFGRSLMGINISPHNGYLRVLYEAGAVGLSAFLWVLATMLRQAVRVLRQSKDDDIKLVAHIYITMTVSYIVLNATDNILEYYEIAIYNWGILSLVEYTNVVAAKRGLIDQESFEDVDDLDDDAVPVFDPLAEPA